MCSDVQPTDNAVVLRNNIGLGNNSGMNPDSYLQKKTPSFHRLSEIEGTINWMQVKLLLKSSSTRVL